MSDIRAGGLPKDMKLQTQLAIKHGENLEEKSLTICSGTDYINVNYQHIVCPDAATAKVSDSITINYIGCVGTEYVCTCTLGESPLVTDTTAQREGRVGLGWGLVGLLTAPC